MGISRQAYYKRNRVYDTRASHDQSMLDFVLEKRRRQPRLGTRKLHHLLHVEAQAGLQVGRDRLFNILREARELVPRKRAYHKTTHSHHRFRRHPNLLKEGPKRIIATGPEQVWVADITYLPTQENVAYLSLVTDVFSRKIVGHHVHESLHTESVIKALEKAIGERKTQQPLVHHSDRGVQYCSELYQQLHVKHGITCSMTDGYDCYQNALAAFKVASRKRGSQSGRAKKTDTLNGLAAIHLTKQIRLGQYVVQLLLDSSVQLTDR